LLAIRFGPFKKQAGQGRRTESYSNSAFDVFVTVDRNLYFQQNISQLKIAVAILVSSTNRVVDLKVLVPTLLAKVAELKPGEIVLISKP
jgi:hypothetical protein